MITSLREEYNPCFNRKYTTDLWYLLSWVLEILNISKYNGDSANKYLNRRMIYIPQYVDTFLQTILSGHSCNIFPETDQWVIQQHSDYLLLFHVVCIYDSNNWLQVKHKSLSNNTSKIDLIIMLLHRYLKTFLHVYLL